jgi:hypothetical protein
MIIAMAAILITPTVSPSRSAAMRVSRVVPTPDQMAYATLSSMPALRARAKAA